MRRSFVALAITTAVAYQLGAQPSPDFDEVRRILRDGMTREGAPAAAFAVVRDGAIIREEAIGWADSANNRRATPSSPFLLASLNKTFETTLAAVLQQQHRLDLDLDRPVNEYLRTTAISSPVWDISYVTVRQLYMHTAGLSTFDIGCDAGRPRDACHMPIADDMIRDYSFSGWASVHDLALFAAFHMKAHRSDQRAILTDGGIDSMQTVTVPTGSGTQRYGLGWWIEDRFGYRTVLSQGGNSGAQAWLRMIPTEHLAVVVLVNKGVAFAGAATDAALAAVLPKYREGMKARELAAASDGAARLAGTQQPRLADSAVVGAWAGVVHTAGGDVPMQLTIAPGGEVQARIGTRSDFGLARTSAQNPGRLFVRISGDLEAASPTGISREMRIYLDRRGAGFGGVITTRPPSATGLDGQVSYWLEIARRP